MGAQYANGSADQLGLREIGVGFFEVRFLKSLLSGEFTHFWGE